MADMAANSEQKRKRRPGRGRPFQPGQSGNPQGRPKAIFKFGEYLRKFLGDQHPQAGQINEKLGYQAVKTRLDEVVLRLLKDKPEVLLHYGFGKPIESFEHTVNAPPVINVRFANDNQPPAAPPEAA